MKCILRKHMYGEVIEEVFCKSKKEARKKGRDYKSKYPVKEQVASKITYSITYYSRFTQ